MNSFCSDVPILPVAGVANNLDEGVRTGVKDGVAKALRDLLIAEAGFK